MNDLGPLIAEMTRERWEFSFENTGGDVMALVIPGFGPNSDGFYTWGRWVVREDLNTSGLFEAFYYPGRSWYGDCDHTTMVTFPPSGFAGFYHSTEDQ